MSGYWWSSISPPPASTCRMSEPSRPGTSTERTRASHQQHDLVSSAGSMKASLDEARVVGAWARMPHARIRYHDTLLRNSSALMPHARKSQADRQVVREAHMDASLPCECIPAKSSGFSEILKDSSISRKRRFSVGMKPARKMLMPSRTENGMVTTP